MVMDFPFVPPPTPSDVPQERITHSLPPESRPLIESIMPTSTGVGDATLIAAKAKGSGGTEISTRGFDSITLPNGWTSKEVAAPKPGYCIEAKPSGSSDATMRLYSNGRALSNNDAQALKNVLDSAGGKSKLLFDSTWENNDAYKQDSARQAQIVDQMNALQNVLGVTQLGDNQFTNSRKPPDQNAPLFHVDRLEVQTLNGKPVLTVEGYFTNLNDGSPQRHYSGIFAPKNEANQGTTVHQASLESTDRMTFMANKAPFKKALNSIDW